MTPLWLLGFLIALLALVGLLQWSEATDKLDRLLHDTWVRAHSRPVPEGVVIAAIDTRSLDALGRWPWPRDLQSLVFEELARLGARAVVVDVIYTAASSEPADDRRLAAALERLPMAILPVLLESSAGGRATERLPLPVFSRAAAGLGHIALPIDDDGIVRRLFLKAGFNRAHWSTLALAAHEMLDPLRFTGDAPPRSAVASAALPGEPKIRATDSAPAKPLAGSSLPGRRIELPPRPAGRWIEDHEVLVPFYGPSGTLSSISVVDLLRGEVAVEAVAGQVVFVGLTAVGLGDSVPTPVSALDRPLPGIEVHATTYAALLDGSLVTQASPRLNYAVAALLLPLLLILYSRLPPQWSVVLALAGAGLPILLSRVLYVENGLWYPPVGASLAMLASYLFWSRHRLEFVNRFLESEQMKLARHLPREDSRENVKLAEFFGHAARHLPIDGWRFTSQGETFEGGVHIAPRPVDIGALGWRERDGVFSRRYARSGRFSIDLAIRDPVLAREITGYIDSLARVRSRVRTSPLAGSVERLQRNAWRLADQLAWLRGVKVFSETVLAGSPVGFVVWNPAGEMVRDNPLVHHLLPSLPGHYELVDFLAALGEDPASVQTRHRLDRLLLNGEAWQLAHEVGETELVVDFSAVGERLSERLVCASVVDMTAMRSAERARAEMVDYLSHDLRSPLISALYAVENEFSAGRVEPQEGDRPFAQASHPAGCSDGSVGSERTDRTDSARLAAGNIRRSLSMMDDLLHVARADSIDVSTLGEVLFNAVLDNALDQLHWQARARRVRFQVDTVDQDLWMQGDASSLERAVVNVLGNAIKYSPEGGDVRVSLGVDDQELVLVISDAGVGIDPDMIDKIFMRFRRDARVVDRYKGIGLGLALVSRVVRQHGGDVSAASAAGEGAAITMRLPLISR